MERTNVRWISRLRSWVRYWLYCVFPEEKSPLSTTWKTESVVEHDNTTDTESGSEVVVLQEVEIIQIEEVEEVTTVSVFPENDPDWDYEVEKKKRGSDHPYVIHRDEYFGQEKDYGQSTLTYYAGDEILVDEEEIPIYQPDKITGPLEFGKGSGDPNVVHVRNDHLEAEYEIIRDSGFYSVEVLGHDVEDFHAKQDEKPIIHKFRQD